MQVYSEQYLSTRDSLTLVADQGIRLNRLLLRLERQTNIHEIDTVEQSVRKTQKR